MIYGFVTGDDTVIGHFKIMGPRVMEEVRQTTQKLGFSLAAYVAERKLTGQVLRNRTGRLRRSIHADFVDTPTSSSSIVGTNVEYAHIHEYGFRGRVTVKEHLRMLREQGKMVLLGKNKHGGIGTWSKRRGKLTGFNSVVRQHDMNMNMPERSFLRSALADKADYIRQEYIAAVKRGTEA